MPLVDSLDRYLLDHGIGVGGVPVVYSCVSASGVQPLQNAAVTVTTNAAGEASLPSQLTKRSGQPIQIRAAVNWGTYQASVVFNLHANIPPAPTASPVDWPRNRITEPVQGTHRVCVSGQSDVARQPKSFVSGETLLKRQ